MTSDSAHLRWGIKESFRRYLEMLPDSQIETSDGASVMPDGTFSFPLQRTSSTEEESRLQFGGLVRVEAHGGELCVAISRPQVWLTGTSGRLSLPDQDIDVALLTNVVRSTDAITAESQLSADGAGWLLPGYYQAGELVDPISIFLRWHDRA